MGILQNSKLKFFIYILIAYTFAVGFRYIWVYEVASYDSFRYNGEIMISNNDGYYFAEGARDILAGFHQENDSSPVDKPLSKITAFIANLLPFFKFESIILYMSAYIGSLLVIPILLLGRSISNDEAGFIGALLGGIAWSYYNRTMVGYFDTDLLVVFLPTLSLAFLILSINRQSCKYLFYAFLVIVFNKWYYPQINSILTALILTMLVYTLIFDRKNKFLYLSTIFVILPYFVIFINIWLLIFIGLGFILIISNYKKLNFDNVLLYILINVFKQVNYSKLYSRIRLDKILLYILIILVLIYTLTGGFMPIWGQLEHFLLRKAESSVELSEGIKLNYYAVTNTIREAGKIPFETFANRISGSVFTFIASCFAYILLCFRYKIMLLSLPMLAIGFLAMKSGLRFTVYAVPIMAFSIGYLLVFLSNFVKKYSVNNLADTFKYMFLSFFTILILIPNINHIKNYMVPVVFTKEEVKNLVKLKSIAKRNDYVISWWDYGFPIRYYADVKTFVDGGKHLGMDNFLTSVILSYPQNYSANMARLTVEFYEFSLNSREGVGVDLFKSMLEKSNIKDPDKLLYYLGSSNVTLPPKTSDIYYYLPYAMLNIFPTINVFSNVDLKTGNLKSSPLFYASNRVKDLKDSLDLGGGIFLNKIDRKITINNKVYTLNNLVDIRYTDNKKLIKSQEVLDKNSFINVILMPSYGKVLVLDNNMFYSSFIQLFFLENYDKELFEPVILDPLTKIYRLKK